jgi:hypothetical protein
MIPAQGICAKVSSGLQEKEKQLRHTGADTLEELACKLHGATMDRNQLTHQGLISLAKQLAL